MIVKLLFSVFICVGYINQTSAQNSFSIAHADSSFELLSNLLYSNGSFKNAVIESERFFQSKKTIDDIFNEHIKSYTYLCNQKNLFSHLLKYKQKDSINYALNYTLQLLFTEGLSIKFDSLDIHSTPFEYDFTDPQGDKDWTNTFVTKLLTTHKGNCRSLTYLYKILADELGAKCWLALAPNHIYIRNYSKQIGWYNTELTSGTFPTDAWIAATGYVNTDAIRSGVYMDTLSNQQSIGLCIMDLAQGYIKQTNNYTDSFVLKCCNLVLQYHSVNPEALLTKAEALKRMYLKQKEGNNPAAQTTYNEMEQTYITLVKLGYREMPYKVYQKWLKSVKQDKEKFLNKKVNVVSKKISDCLHGATAPSQALRQAHKTNATKPTCLRAWLVPTHG